MLMGKIAVFGEKSLKIHKYIPNKNTEPLLLN